MSSHFSLTPAESKLISIAIANYFRFKDPSMLFKVSDLAKIMPTSKKNAFAQLRANTLTLVQKAFEIQEENLTRQLNWFSCCTYYHGQGLVELDINPRLLPYLEYNKEIGYTKYNLKYILPLQSKYAVRMYELFKKIQKLKKNIFSIKDLRETLGVSYDKYPQSTDFIKRVVKQCQNEFIKHTDIKFDYTTLKRGHTITHLEFNILKNHPVIRKEAEQNKQLKGIDLSEELQHLYESLQSFDLAENTINEFMNKYEPSYIYEKMELVDIYVRKMIKEEKPFNSSMLIMKAINKDWKVGKNSRYKKISESKKTNKAATEKAYNDIKVLESLEKDYDKYSLEVVKKAFDQLEDEERNELKLAFQESLLVNSFLDFEIPISEINMANSYGISGSFVGFVQEQKDISLLSLNEWCEIHTDHRVEKVDGEWKIL